MKTILSSKVELSHNLRCFVCGQPNCLVVSSHHFNIKYITNLRHRKFQKKYVLLNAENTQESFLSDMIRNRFPESSLILSISSHSPLLRFNKSFLCSSILLVRMTLGTGRTQNLFSSFIPTE